MQIDYNSLNAAQKKAVLSTEKPLLLLAGAGSGKTRVICYRIGHLITKCKIDPKNVLALTFTNKSAKEMRERVKNLIPNKGSKVNISTFHALGVRILREYITLLGFKKNFIIYNTHDQQLLIKNIIEDMDIEDEAAFKPNDIHSIIMSGKNKGHEPDYFLNQKQNPREFLIGKIYEEYEELLFRYNAIDFENILKLTLKLFRNHNDQLGELKNCYEYIMVDEYQDTNKIQYEILSYLGQKTKKICVVGDDDQSIYGWRGADIRNILDFQKDYPNAEIIPLEQNYRSTEVILQAANHVIKNNKERMAKTLWTNQNSGDKIKWVHKENELEEIEEVVKEIKLTKMSKGWSWDQFAILYRSNFHSRGIEEALREDNIPYILMGSLKFFDRKEIQDCLAYLKILQNTNDEVSFHRVINYPKRGVGKSTLIMLNDLRTKYHCSSYEALKKGIQLQHFSDSLCKNADAFIQLIDSTKERLKTESFNIVFKDLFKSMLMDREIEKDEKNAQQAQKKINNLYEFYRGLDAYKDKREDASLEKYLEYVSLFTDGDDEKYLKNKVTLMTIHSSKGLEFDHVSLVRLTDDQFPNRKSVLEKGEDEERRLFYVAITRARKSLLMSASKTKKFYGEEQTNAISRFVQEIPSELYEQPPITMMSETQKQEVKEKSRSDFFKNLKNKK